MVVGFFVYSFSAYLEKNVLCIQLLRKNSHGYSFGEFVNINSSTLNLSKTSRSLKCGFIKNTSLYIQNQFYLNLNSFGTSVASLSVPVSSQNTF